ncbi:hypothetical protein B0A49_05930 [Cryomyces minteri]|uniref:Uncharacterized protein n=1 Tax=Cryomyces minteri TaxID=331657 RepID=A0A4U0WZ82_9PEZI|nr:hypothetical protein B0A49_05930 [Cryomyces minteri]
MSPLTRDNPALAGKIESLRLPLAPLRALPSGEPHPIFPLTVLHFWLLTEAELDALAHHYHQSTPSEWSFSYPVRMNWDKRTFSHMRGDAGTAAAGERLKVKRRKFGNFIGLRGCETPVEEVEWRIRTLRREIRERVDREMEEGKRWHYRRPE